MCVLLIKILQYCLVGYVVCSYRGNSELRKEPKLTSVPSIDGHSKAGQYCYFGRNVRVTAVIG